ncbi:terminase large subunit domain-containing protein [Tritonibacter mobilis]|uniref:terminase large subunit domain-containing protein n=1 Tax=Tritonibacter mobilis TaxID=379347 RepID=UPI000806A0E5|nr:terminase family protein [Tritonibacter mobilis]
MTAATAITDAEWEAQRAADRQMLPDVLNESMDLPHVLLSYQQQLLQTTALYQFVVCEKSRRIGMTWAVGADAVLTSGLARSEGGMDTLYIGFNLDMAREFIDTCAMWAKAFMPAASSVQEFLFKDQEEGKEERDIQAFRIRFASGFEVVALSSKPRSLRGRQGYVIFDEAAFHDELEEMLKAANALLMWGGKVLVISTHDGDANAFNVLVRQVNEGEKGDTAKVVRVTFNDAVGSGLYERIALIQRAQGREPMGKQKWIDSTHAVYGDDADEELHCIPKAGTGAWLTAPLIEARMNADAPCLELELPGDYLQRAGAEQQELMRPFLERLEEVLDALPLDVLYALGFDFARVADLSVLCLLAIEKNMHRREALTIEMRNVPGNEQKLIVGMVMDRIRTRCVGAAFDATGMGWTVAEDMGRKFGLKEGDDSPGMVWAIKFSQDWYRVNMPPLKTAFEEATLSIGRWDAHMGDLRAVKKVRGIPRVPEIREADAKGKKRHGDYAIALALAHFASRMRWVEIAYTPVPDNRNSEPQDGRMGMTVEEQDALDRPWWKEPLGTSIRGGL